MNTKMAPAGHVTWQANSRAFQLKWRNALMNTAGDSLLRFIPSRGHLNGFSECTRGTCEETHVHPSVPDQLDSPNGEERSSMEGPDTSGSSPESNLDGGSALALRGFCSWTRPPLRLLRDPGTILFSMILCFPCKCACHASFSPFCFC